MRRRVLLATPILVAQAPGLDRVVDQLLFARAMLCADCDNDLEREGVNRPARRSMIGADKLLTALEMLDAVPASPATAEARRHIDKALAYLDSMDEAEAMETIDLAVAALRR